MPVKSKVLLIEDDTFLSGLYATKFGMEGFEVYSATDGEAGLKLAKEKSPDVILLDIILPVKDGFEVLAALKKDPATKMTPVILLTNLSQKEDAEKGLKQGAVDYLIKAHFMPSEVVDKVKKYIKT
ncbi:MAG: response regulator [bacterium]